VNFDEIVMRDLLADYARRVGLQVLSGTGATGQVLGLRNVTGIEDGDVDVGPPTAVELQRRWRMRSRGCPGRCTSRRTRS
jgi:hypothetical protein